ncbi:hypothetical protein GCM10023329_20720 [Streptomyces sanyensis]|uniref:Transposase n=1 Tax=Streptomyces sanyensis TaxID=568869 RepID=A0ABP9A4L0_9ACTN
MSRRRRSLPRDWIAANSLKVEDLAAPGKLRPALKAISLTLKGKKGALRIALDQGRCRPGRSRPPGRPQPHGPFRFYAKILRGRQHKANELIDVAALYISTEDLPLITHGNGKPPLPGAGKVVAPSMT